ncbi:MAG: DMT family transporter [Gammaproteobacteria bacterium]|nr:MAG: DMT family transporter [Gammaproteobacteria bacterium]
MKDERRATLFALATVLLWSTVASAFKLSLRHLAPVELLVYATGCSTLVLGLLLVLQRKLLTALSGLRQSWGLALRLGVLNPLLYYLVLFKAYDLLPAQLAQPLNYTWAITLSLLAVPLLGQAIGRRQWLALVIGYGGVLVITTEGKPWALQFSDPLGVALALFSTVLWALYWIFNTRDRRDPFVALFQNFLCGLPLVLLCWLLIGPVRRPPVEGLLGAAYVGAFEMGICYVLWLMALKKTDHAARIGNLIFLSPFLSLLLIHFLVGEEILPSTFVGLALIVGGLALQNTGKPGGVSSAAAG